MKWSRVIQSQHKFKKPVLFAAGGIPIPSLNTATAKTGHIVDHVTKKIKPLILKVVLKRHASIVKKCDQSGGKPKNQVNRDALR